MQTPDWYHTDPLAKTLSQLSEDEFRKFADSDLLDVRPVILPRPRYVVGHNDYFMWPIATRVEDTVVVLYQRVPCHFPGPDKALIDEDSGIRMIVRSTDGGATYGEPLDLLGQAGAADDSPFYGFGAGLGSHDGILYAALNQGLYRSDDRGATWRLITGFPKLDEAPDPLWAPGMRITFDDAHGLVIWTTAGFSTDQKVRASEGKYGTHLVALYSPDFGSTWHIETQPLPDEVRLSEITPLPFDGKLAFFLRQRHRHQHFAQAYSDTGWFPFDVQLTNVGPVDAMDTPDLLYNPKSQRLEAATPDRIVESAQPGDGMKLHLYSIAPDALAAGENQWRFDGTLVTYRDRFGKSDGFNVVGGVIDPARDRKLYHVWAGDCHHQAGIFQYAVSLDTDAVRQALMASS